MTTTTKKTPEMRRAIAEAKKLLQAAGHYVESPAQPEDEAFQDVIEPDVKHKQKRIEVLEDELKKFRAELAADERRAGIFIRIAEHLLEQGAKSMASDGKMCAYRGVSIEQEPMGCAVGHLISDSAYSCSLEGRRGRDGQLIKALDTSGIPTDEGTLSMLFSAQWIHDKAEVEEWPYLLERLAALSGLEGWRAPEGWEPKELSDVVADEAATQLQHVMVVEQEAS